jgi:hypothetical protein
LFQKIAFVTYCHLTRYDKVFDGKRADATRDARKCRRVSYRFCTRRSIAVEWQECAGLYVRQYTDPPLILCRPICFNLSMSESFSPSPRKSGRGPLLFIILGCGGLAVLSVLAVVGIMIAGIFIGGQAVDPEVESFFSRYNSERYTAIYKDSHPKLQESIAEEKIAATLAGIHKVLGDYQSKSMKGIHINKNLGSNTAQASYLANFTSGTATVTIIFLDDGGSWKLARFDFQSDLINAALTCPKCSVKMKEFGKFCPNCGIAIES